MGLFDVAAGVATGGIYTAAKALQGRAGRGLPTQTGYDEERQKAIADRINKLRGDLSAIPAAKPLGAEAPAYKASTQAYQPQLNSARVRAGSQASAETQQANDAVTRRFAAMGGLGSGAYIKQTELQQQRGEDRKAEAMSKVDAQEADLMSHELDKEYQSGEAAKGRGLQREMYNSDLDFKDKVFRFDSNSKLAQMQLAFEQSDRDSQDQEFNKQLSLYQAKNQGGLLGAGGFAGTGLF